MRRPTQRPGLAAAHGWAHPYTGIHALTVFHADGGDDPQTPPTPADLANQQRKNVPVELRDPETGVVMTQERFAQNMAKERRAGRHAALREIAEAAGVQFDIDNFDASKFGQLFKDAQAARQAQLTEEQRRREELEQLQQSLEQRQAQIDQQAADAARLDRETRIRSALVRLGATGDDLDDAAALLRVADDADDTAIAEAAEKLKERRSELFGTAPAPQQQALPPAPGGAPAGGGPRQQATKDDIQERARKRAEQMGFRRAG